MAAEFAADVDPYQAQIDAIRAKLAQPVAPRYTPTEIAGRRARNDRDYQLGLLGMLSGNEGLGGVGGMLAKQAIAGRTPTVTERGTADPLSGEFSYSPAYQSERDEAQLAALLQRSAAAQGQRQQARESAADRRETAFQLAGFNAQNQRALAAMQQGNAQGQREQARADRLATQTDQDTQAFSKRAETLTPLLYAASEVQSMLSEYGDKSIPGVGYDALMGPMLSREGVVNKSKVQAVANALLRAQSGQAVSLSEEARAAAQTLSSGRYSEEEFRRGWPQIVGSLNSQVGNIAAGYSPEAVNTFARRGGNFAPVTTPSAGHGAGPSTGGATGSWGDEGGTAAPVDFSALPTRGGHR